MKNPKRLPLLFVILLCGAQLCKAQREDTLKLKPQLPIPDFTTPTQPIKAKDLLVPAKLSLDGLEYLPSSSPPSDSTGLVQGLSVENFLKYYHDDFLKWEEDTYGWNFDLHQFTRKNGKYLAPSKFLFKAIGIMDTIEQKYANGPYPLAHGVNDSYSAISNPFGWAPSKHDICFNENFGWEKRILYNNVSVAKFGFRDIIEYQRVQLANRIIEQRKIELGGTYNPDLSNLKRRIRQLRSEIKGKIDAVQELSADSIP